MWIFYPLQFLCCVLTCVYTRGRSPCPSSSTSHLQGYLALAADLPVDADPQYDGFDPDEYGDVWYDAEEAFDEDPDEDIDAEEGIQEQPVPQQPGKPPRSDTGAYLHYSLAEFIHDDHEVTVREVTVWLAKLASDHRLPNAAMDSLCQMVHFLLLPPGNLFPRSYHMLRCALAAEDSHSCESHVCDECWKVFPAIPAGSHAEHADEVCARPGCDNTRFKRGPGGHVSPKRSAFFFGDEDTFADLASKPHMLPAILQHRKEALDDPESFWCSPAGKELNMKCRNKFDQTDINGDEFAVLVSLGASLACAQCDAAGTARLPSVCPVLTVSPKQPCRLQVLMEGSSS